MTKKDYVAFANVIAVCLREAKRDPEAYTPATKVADVAMGLVNVLARDNPAFDRGRFLAACGLA